MFFSFLRRIGAVFLFVLVLTSSASGQSVYCTNWWMGEDGLEVTHNVTITGSPIVLGSWGAEHDTLTIWFNEEEPLIWNPKSVGTDRIGALADWVWTAKNFESESGFPAFAGRDEYGQVWLVSQYLDYTGEEWTCFAHRLDQLRVETS